MKNETKLNKMKPNHPVIGIMIATIGTMLFITACSAATTTKSKTNSSAPSTQGNSQVESQETVNEETITLDEFNQIQTGMSYEEVCNIVGSEGTVMSTATVMDSTTTIYCWYADNKIANANVTIQDDKVMAKAQIGLQ